MNEEGKTNGPSGAEARIFGTPGAARLKPSPFKTIYEMASEN